MADRVSLGESIRSAVPPTPRRCQTWWEKLDAETLAELEAIREEWRSGRLHGTKNGLAAVIAQQLAARKLSYVGRQGVVAWLGKKG